MEVSDTSRSLHVRLSHNFLSLSAKLIYPVRRRAPTMTPRGPPHAPPVSNASELHYTFETF